MARKKNGLAASSEGEGKELTSGESTKKGFSLTIGRVINFFIAVVFLGVFIAAVVVVGTLADVQRGVGYTRTPHVQRGVGYTRGRVHTHATSQHADF